jgi:LEA14-like dessication related protein
MRVLVSFIALLAVSCSRPSPPTLTPQRAEVTAVGTAGISLLVQMAADNPNRFGLSARQVTAEVTLDGRHKLGAVTLPEAIDLPAKKSTRIDVPLSVAWNDLPSVIALAATGRSIPYAVDGTVSIGGDVIHVELPYHLTGEITREQLRAALINSVPKNWVQ